MTVPVCSVRRFLVTLFVLTTAASARAQYNQGEYLVVSRPYEQGGLLSLYENAMFPGDPTFGRRTLKRQGGTATWSASVPVATTDATPLRSGGAVAIRRAQTSEIVFHSALGTVVGSAVTLPFRVLRVVESSSGALYGLGADARLVRLQADGTLVTTFGTDGRVTTCADASDLAALGNDDVLVVCGASGTVERIDASGTPVSTFGPGGRVALGGVILGMPRELASGHLQAVVSGGTQREIVRLTATGQADARFSVPDSVIGAPAIFSNGVVWFYGDGVPLRITGITAHGETYGRWEGAETIDYSSSRPPAIPIRGPILVDGTDTAYLHYSYTTHSLDYTTHHAAFQTQRLRDYPPEPPAPHVPASPRTKVYPARLEWNPVSGASYYVVEVSGLDGWAYPNPRRAILRMDSTAGSQIVLDGFATLNRYDTSWRVRAIGSSGLRGVWSARIPLEVVPAPPVLIAPAVGDTVVQPVEFRIESALTHIAIHRIEVALDTSFATVVASAASSTGSSSVVLTTHLPAGTYFWRARTQVSDIGLPQGPWGPYSAASRFEVPGALTAPMQTSPADGETQTSPVTLAWSRVAGASSYVVQTTSSPTFATGVDSTVVTETRLERATAPGTTFYWRVRAKNATTIGPYSSIRSVTVVAAMTVPTALTPSGGTVVDLPVALSWSPVSGATRYHWQIARTSDFAALTDSGTVSAPPVAPTLPSGGAYYWRVRAANGLSASPYASASFVALPAAPTLTSPEDGAVGLVPRVRIAWTLSPQATHHQIEITRASDNGVALDTLVSVPASEVSARLSPMTLYRVRARAISGVASTWSATRAFATGQAVAAESGSIVGFALHLTSPAHGDLVGRYASPEPFAYALLNVLGAVVARGQAESGAGTLAIPRAGLAAGVYVLRVQLSDGEPVVRRVVLL